MSLNLAISFGHEMRTLLGNFGLDLPSYRSNDAWMLPIPTFVVGTVDRILDPDYRRRMPIENLLGTLRTAH